MSQYPIGQPGQAWTETDKLSWLSRQRKLRDYQQLVCARIEALASRFELIQYGQLDYRQLPAQCAGHYPLYALRLGRTGQPQVLITGGVHGYETSGVMGALLFLEQRAAHYSEDFELLVAPCVSPWGFETINRWNPYAEDPNRSFGKPKQAPEAEQLLQLLAAQDFQPMLHVDLHETTDSDNTEFRPALAARDGVSNKNWNIPDGFYLVDCSERPQPGLQKAMLDSVRKVTHIAEADNEGKLIGTPISQPGVIEYDTQKLGLCTGMSTAGYTSTTEVYPDSPRTSPKQCAQAQLAAIEGALNFLYTAW